MNQTAHLANPGKAPTQNSLILARLALTPGRWVGVLELYDLSGSLAVHSRIADIRKDGHFIEQRSERVDGRVHSSYRLMPPDLAHALAAEYQT